MPNVPITKKTAWECQMCGGCCRGVILSKKESLSVEVDGAPVCKFLENNKCINYAERPFICRIYPFVVDFNKMKCTDGIARPSIAFALENLEIHSDCPGYGKGKRVYGNKKLQKQIDKICYDFSIKLKEAVDKKIDVSEII